MKFYLHYEEPPETTIVIQWPDEKKGSIKDVVQVSSLDYESSSVTERARAGIQFLKVPIPKDKDLLALIVIPAICSSACDHSLLQANPQNKQMLSCLSHPELPGVASHRQTTD
jgi:hypothetical protein